MRLSTKINYEYEASGRGLFLCTEMFGFCDGLEKTGGEVCSVFDI